MTETEAERLSPDELRTLFLFEELDDEKLTWLTKRGRIVEYPVGATVHAEGAPASCFLVLLTGEISMSRRVHGGEIELNRTSYRGAYTGAFNAWIADRGVPQVYPVTARAVTDASFFELPAADFGRAVKEWFPMAAHLLEGAATQGQAASDTVERHERLVALGSVTAGLTHELNNPVAAVMRAAATMRERIGAMRTEIAKVAKGALTAQQLEGLSICAGKAVETRRDAPVLSPMETADREDELVDWLEDHNISNAWDIASTFVSSGLGIEFVEEIESIVPSDLLEASLTYPARVLESDALLDEITDAAGRISGLLASAKQYTQMDRAPMQTFDVHEGLDATLTMLGHKIGASITVVRDYDRSLPQIAAFPGELNQVWTNLIDNAIDAMDGQGTLTVRTFLSDNGNDRLVVEIGDTGPGVPEEIRTRIFEPFFTTKQIGRGTGLGLDIAWRIVVVRHHGDIHLESQPGDTRFQVLLPLEQSD